MSLDLQSWRHARDQVAVGERKMFEHDCGEGKKLVVSRDTRGWSAWCFRCSDGDWAPGPQETTAERLQRIKGEALCDQGLETFGALEIPDALTYAQASWPAWAKLWFYKAGLSSRDIAIIGAGYDPGSNRVVLPLRDLDGNLAWWQARGGPDRAPKYLSPCAPNRFGCYGNLATAKRDKRVILTEDMLSAYKVAKAGNFAIPLCGTALRPAVVKHLVHEHGKHTVVIWLDPDPPGVAASKRVLKFLLSIGIVAYCINSEDDPKMHSIDAINGYIG